MENKKEVRRYYLCYKVGRSDLLHFVNFSKNEEGKYVLGKEDMIHDGEPLRGQKYTLAQIDEFTNSFDSCQDFFNTVSPYLSYGVVNEDNFQIKYNQEGIKSLRVIFGNKELKEKTEMVSISCIYDGEEINQFVDKLIYGDNKFVWFINNESKGKYKNYDIDLDFLRKACEIRKDYIFAKQMNIDESFIGPKKEKLKSSLTRYKNYREVFTFKQEYEKTLSNKPKVKTKEKNEE